MFVYKIILKFIEHHPTSLGICITIIQEILGCIYWTYNASKLTVTWGMVPVMVVVYATEFLNREKLFCERAKNTNNNLQPVLVILLWDFTIHLSINLIFISTVDWRGDLTSSGAVWVNFSSLKDSENKFSRRANFSSLLKWGLLLKSKVVFATVDPPEMVLKNLAICG